MKESIKTELLKLIGIDWKPAGLLEDTIRAKYGNKASCVSRRLRELENEGKLERQYVQINGKGVRFVQYRLAPNTPFMLSFRPEIIKSRMQEKFKCIQKECDGNGAIPNQVDDGVWEADQCQFHAEYIFPIKSFLRTSHNTFIDHPHPKEREENKQTTIWKKN